MRTTSRAVAAGAIAATAMLASSTALAQQPSRTLTIAAQTAPSALDPHYHNSIANAAALRHIFEALYETDAEARLRPSLAEEIRGIDDLTWEVRLRPGVRFHDGTPLEAEDVAWTFARVPAVPNSPALYTPQVRTISAVEIKDPLTRACKIVGGWSPLG